MVSKRLKKYILNLNRSKILNDFQNARIIELIERDQQWILDFRWCIMWVIARVARSVSRKWHAFTYFSPS